MLRTTAAIVTLASLAAALRAATPPNDLCENAQVIPEFGGSVPGTTAGATADAVQPCAGAEPGPVGVWFRYQTPPGFPGFETLLSLCGSAAGWDSRISVYAAGPCGALVCIAGDDNGCPFGPHGAIFRLFDAGTDLLILVHGAPGASGDFTLSVGTGDLFDCNLNGVPDAQDIAADPRLDCYNPAVITNPHRTGGPDGALDLCQCQADFNRDGQVSSTDISAFLTSWLASAMGPLLADINCSGITNSTDISVFLSLWLDTVTDNFILDGCP